MKCTLAAHQCHDGYEINAIRSVSWHGHRYRDHHWDGHQYEGHQRYSTGGQCYIMHTSILGEEHGCTSTQAIGIMAGEPLALPAALLQR